MRFNLACKLRIPYDGKGVVHTAVCHFSALFKMLEAHWICRTDSPTGNNFYVQKKLRPVNIHNWIGVYLMCLWDSFRLVRNYRIWSLQAIKSLPLYIVFILLYFCNGFFENKCVGDDFLFYFFGSGMIVEYFPTDKCLTQKSLLSSFSAITEFISRHLYKLLWCCLPKRILRKASL